MEKRTAIIRTNCCWSLQKPNKKQIEIGYSSTYRLACVAAVSFPFSRLGDRASAQANERANERAWCEQRKGRSGKGERLEKKWPPPPAPYFFALALSFAPFACFETSATQALTDRYIKQRTISKDIRNELLVITFVVITIVRFVNSALSGHGGDACYRAVDSHFFVFIWLVHKYFVNMRLKRWWFRTLHVERPVAFSRLIVVF